MKRHEAHMKALEADEENLIKEFYENRVSTTEIQQVTDPAHYNSHQIEPITYIMANDLDFAEGNVVKYVSRWRQKGGVADLHKARQYLDFIIKNEEEGSPL